MTFPLYLDATSINTTIIILEYFVGGITMSQIFGIQKLHMAVLNLVGPGSMQSRVKNAVNSHLRHISVGSDIPEEFGDEYLEIINSLTESVALSEIDAEHCAQKIVNLHDKCSHFVH